MASRHKRHSGLSQYITVKDLFRHLPHTLLREMMGWTIREFLPSGTVLFNEGDTGMDLYILAAGRLRYEKPGEAGKTDTGEFHRLDILGELSLFTGEPRSATVVAIRDSELIRIPRDLALAILLKNPQSLLQITTIIAERLARARKRTEAKRKSSASYCLLPTNRDMVLDPFLDVMVPAIKEAGKFRIIRESNFLSVFPRVAKSPDKELEHNILNWFQDLEDENDFLFYLGGYEDTDWSKRCIRQSDRVLLFQDSGQNPEKNPSELLLAQSSLKYKAIDLVLLHPSYSSLPSQTKAHLEIRRLSRHYHVHINTPSTMERLMRGILGNSIGLALGGGGAKGFAHLGILRSLEEHQVPIDIVSGTSAGSVFAAMIALGYDSKVSRLEAKKFWVDRDLLNEYTLPVLSLVTGKKYTEAIREFFTDIKIEDLWIPYYAVSTDLSNSEGHIHDAGFLWKAIRSSTSLPGIVPPFIENGTVYVDGGVMDNVPGLLLKDRGAGKIISVDVFGDIYPDQDKELSKYFDASNPGVLENPIFQLGNLINFKNIFKPKFPPIGDIIIRSILVSSRERIRQTQKVSELFLQIPTNNFGVLEWHSYEKLIEIGYLSSHEHIGRFKEKYKESLS